jgi:hypothetical protein
MRAVELYGAGNYGGGPISDITDIIGQAGALIGAVVADPALPEVLQLGTELMQYEQSASGANPSGPGIGLSAAVPYLKFYVWYRENHVWAPWVLGAAILGLPLLAGIAIGRHIGR